MSFSTVTYTGNGVVTQFAVPFPYINQSDVSVQVNGTTQAFTWANSTTIQLSVAPANGATVYIFRTTSIANASVTFADGSVLRAADLNSEFTQVLYSLQEDSDQTTAAINTARAQSGNLPVVSSADNGKVLAVSAGVWTAGLMLAADTSLTSAAAGLSVHIADTSLTTASGLKVNLMANGGLQISSGVGLLLRDTSLVLGGLGVGVNLATNSGLQISSGLGLLLADTTLTKNVNGVLVQLAPSGGIANNSGIYVRGVQVVSADPGSPTSGDTWYNSTFGTFRRQEAGGTLGFSGIIYRNTAISTAIANTAALTACNLSASIPANHLSTGKKLRIRGSGLWGATGTSPTLIIALYRDGTTSVIDSFTIACGTVTAGRFDFMMELTVFTTGVGGTWQPNGLGFSENLATAAAQQTMGNNGTLTIDTTASHTLNLAVQWSAASVSNTVTVKTFSVEILDP